MDNPLEDIDKILEKEKENAIALHRYLTSDKCDLPPRVKSFLNNHKPQEYLANGFDIALTEQDCRKMALFRLELVLPDDSSKTKLHIEVTHLLLGYLSVNYWIERSR